MQLGPSAPPFDQPGAYAYWSTRPLHILAFLLPLVIAYEVGSALTLAGPGTDTSRTIRAELILDSFFRLFGVGGLYLPGILLVVVLTFWHLLSRDRWRLHPPVLAWMLLEAALWTLPLLVMGQILQRAFRSSLAPMAQVAAQSIYELPALTRATISIGAGVYEELLFRLVGIALVHAIAADLLRVRDGPAKVVAVFVSAIAFALYHDVSLSTGGIDPARLTIFFLAGLYFGTVYVLRGFGIVVAVHALYDLAVLVLLPA